MHFRRPIHYFMCAACCSVYTTTASHWHFAGVNIAYGKPATQGPGTYNNRLSSGIIQNYTANLAVDGHTSGRFEDLSCTHTNGPSSANAYWKVDLQKAYKITGMIIYNREGFEERLKNFIIYGNETEVIHNSHGSDEYRQSVIHIELDEKRFFSSITVLLPANYGHSESGMYYLTLCEVEIYTATCGYMNITNGEIKPNQDLYEVNTQALNVCNEGFEPAMQNITCSNIREWTYYKPCTHVYCAYPGKPLNGDYLQNHAIYLPSSLPYGSVITFRCDLGYRSENNVNRTCQRDGYWSGEASVCTKEQCSYSQAKQKTFTVAVIGGISGAVMLVVIIISGLVVYIVRRRKKYLKEQEEVMTYTNLRKKQERPSNNDYAEINAMELEKVASSTDTKPKERENAAYCNTTIEL